MVLHFSSSSCPSFCRLVTRLWSQDPVMQDKSVAIQTISNPAKTATMVLPPTDFVPFQPNGCHPYRALLKRAVKGHKLGKGTLN